MRIRAVYENNVLTRFKGLRAVTPIILMHITGGLLLKCSNKRHCYTAVIQPLDISRSRLN